MFLPQPVEIDRIDNTVYDPPTKAFLIEVDHVAKSVLLQLDDDRLILKKFSHVVMRGGLRLVPAAGGLVKPV